MTPPNCHYTTLFSLLEWLVSLVSSAVHRLFNGNVSSLPAWTVAQKAYLQDSNDNMAVQSVTENQAVLAVLRECIKGTADSAKRLSIDAWDSFLFQNGVPAWTTATKIAFDALPDYLGQNTISLDILLGDGALEEFYKLLPDKRGDWFADQCLQDSAETSKLLPSKNSAGVCSNSTSTCDLVKHVRAVWTYNYLLRTVLPEKFGKDGGVGFKDCYTTTQSLIDNRDVYTLAMDVYEFNKLVVKM